MSSIATLNPPARLAWTPVSSLPELNREVGGYRIIRPSAGNGVAGLFLSLRAMGARPSFEGIWKCVP